MRKVIVVAALESEFFSAKGQIETIHYTGIGKINSARATTQLILEKMPDLIINVGTAGCLKRENFGEIFGIREVIERDMIAEPLAPRGTVPMSNQASVLFSEFGSARCATGDSFVTAQDIWLVENGVDLVDMELFAIAKVSNHYGVQWKSIKFASDLADVNAANDWTESLKNTDDKISEMIETAFSL
jgi:adenosylhomocysteine nucleosidase